MTHSLWVDIVAGWLPDYTGICNCTVKKTVNCNLFLTDPKNARSAKTQWFLESLYREVLVFWCLITVRCVEIFLSELFQYRAFATPYKAWTLLYSYTPIQTLNKSINSTQISLEKFPRHPFNICRQHKTVKDVIRHHQTPGNAIWCQQKPTLILEQHFWVCGNVCWCCLVSVVFLKCPEISGGDVWEHFGEVCVCLEGLNAFKGVKEC